MYPIASRACSNNINSQCVLFRNTMHFSYSYISYTVEPLLTKGYLSIKDKCVVLQDHGNTILPLKEDNLSITVKLASSKVRSFTI